MIILNSINLKLLLDLTSTARAVLQSNLDMSSLDILGGSKRLRHSFVLVFFILATYPGGGRYYEPRPEEHLKRGHMLILVCRGSSTKFQTGLHLAGEETT